MTLIPFQINPSAVSAIKEIIASKNIPLEYGVRVGIKGASGCGGAQFVLGFDQRQAHDDVYELDTLTVYMDRRHALYLAGKVIEYRADSEEVGFVFTDGNQDQPS